MNDESNEAFFSFLCLAASRLVNRTAQEDNSWGLYKHCEEMPHAFQNDGAAGQPPETCQEPEPGFFPALNWPYVGLKADNTANLLRLIWTFLLYFITLNTPRLLSPLPSFFHWLSEWRGDLRIVSWVLWFQANQNVQGQDIKIIGFLYYIYI